MRRARRSGQALIAARCRLFRHMALPASQTANIPKAILAGPGPQDDRLRHGECR